MDVLIFTPVYRLEPETVEALMNLEADGPISLLMQRDNPYPGDGFGNHLHQYRRGREILLSGPYEAMLVIESDIIPPPDTLRRLLALDCDLAYGCCQFRGTDAVNITYRYPPWPQPARRNGDSLSHFPSLYQAAVQQGIIDCSGSGLGCILIKRRVLEETPFEPAGGFFDHLWTKTVCDRNYRMKADMGLRCGHKDMDGNIFWPGGLKLYASG